MVAMVFLIIGLCASAFASDELCGTVVMLVFCGAGIALELSVQRKD